MGHYVSEMDDLEREWRRDARTNETREEEAKREALEKLIHDRRWERDGYGQLKRGGDRK